MKLQYLQVGEIVTTHGVRGEMKLLPWADGPEFLCDFSRVRIDEKEYKLTSCRTQKTCNLIALEGVNTMEQAQAMRGKIVEIFRQDAPDSIIFAAELIGVRVFADGEHIGDVTQVLDYPGNKVYVVNGEHEYMIPAVKQFILSTDIEKNEMHVMLIEGMGSHES